MPNIPVTDISRHFGDRKCLEDVNVSLGVGRRCGLTGPKGPGKSTFTKILSGNPAAIRWGCALLVGLAMCLSACTSDDRGNDAGNPGVGVAGADGGLEPSDAGNDAGASSEPCLHDQHVVENACVACPPGTTREAGDEPSGADTLCGPVLCGADAHVMDHACVGCAPGLSRDAGDDASGADTACELVPCALDQHVVSHGCVDCASSTNAAGDDPTGADTACDGTRCADGFRVSNHTCVACPAGFDDPLAPDAAGSDTQCTCITPWARPDAGCGYCMQPTGGTPTLDCSAPNNAPHLLLQDEDRDTLTIELGQAVYHPNFSIIDVDLSAQGWPLYAVHAELTGLPAASFDVAAFTSATGGNCSDALYATPREIYFVCQLQVVNNGLAALELPSPNASGTAVLTVTASDNGWFGSVPLSDQTVIYADYF